MYKKVQTALPGFKTPEQEYLEVINKPYSFQEAVKILDRINWDFKDFTTQYLTHKFHSYPARFIPQIPLTFIKLFTKEGDIVLDPMCGCGTTLVESVLNNRVAIGNDFNPLATLISKVKVTLIPEGEFRFFKAKLRQMKRYLDLDYKKIDKQIELLPNRKLSRIFNRTIISKLEVIRETLVDIKEEGDHDDIYDVGRVALSSTIWSLIENGGGLDVDDFFLRKIKMMEYELRRLRKIIPSKPKVQILNGDARNLKLNDKSVDLIVTSPPYVNALDYYRIHMYNMLWLGMDFDLFKKHEIGAHSHFIYNRFRLLSEYLGDMLRVLIEMNRVLRKDKISVIVVGNSSLEYELIESHKFLSEMSSFVGFKPIKTIFRNIDKTRKYTSKDIGRIDDEYILILQKIEDKKISAKDDEFISRIVTQQMLKFKKQLEKVQGTSTRGKKPTKERLLKNIEKIEEAIKNIPNDIKIKK